MKPLDRMQALLDRLGVRGGEAVQIIDLLDEELDKQIVFTEDEAARLHKWFTYTQGMNLLPIDYQILEKAKFNDYD